MNIGIQNDNSTSMNINADSPKYQYYNVLRLSFVFILGVALKLI